MQENDKDIDDKGTDQSEASTILKSLRDQVFEASDEKLALGRPTDEVEAWWQGTEPIDGDVIIKARGIAMERGVEVK